MKKSEILETLLQSAGEKYPGIPLSDGWRLEYEPTRGWLVMKGCYTVLMNSKHGGIYFKTAHKAYKAWKGHRRTYTL